MNDNATATKFQIMQETGINGYTWDIVTNRNNIKPIKNYMDENNRFCSVFDRQYVVEKINEFIKNNDNDLQECFNDKALTTIKKLAESWNVSESSVRNRLKKANIRPFKIVELGYGRQCFFYKKRDCAATAIDSKSNIVIEQPKAVELEKSENQKEFEKWLNDDRYVTIKKLAIDLNRDISTIHAHLKINGIRPRFRVRTGDNNNNVAVDFYDAYQCAEFFKNRKYNYKIHITKVEMLNITTLTLSALNRILYVNNLRVLFFSVGESKRKQGGIYDRQAALTALADKLKPEYRHLLEKEPKPMQTPDFIPADTLDIYNLDQLKAKIPGIENHYEMFNKSEVPEYQEIARMMRGNQKSVNLWGKMVEGIKKEVGAMVEVAPMYDENIKRFTVPDKYFVQNTDRLMTYREVSILLKESVGSLRNKVSCLSLKPTIINRKAYFNTNQVEMMRGKTVTDIKKDRLTELEEKVSELEQIVVKLKNSLQSLLK